MKLFCIKDNKKKITGKEPSPKGLGFCAHTEKINTKKKGRDGNDWIVKKTKTSKRWFRLPKNKKTKKKVMISNELKDETDIIIWEKQNLKDKFTKIKSGKISLHKNGWFSMIYEKKNYIGRIYFSLSDLEQRSISIEDVKIEEKSNILSFVYNGEWEDWENNKIIKVKKYYKIKFNSEDSFNIVKEIVNKFIN